MISSTKIWHKISLACFGLRPGDRFTYVWEGPGSQAALLMNECHVSVGEASSYLSPFKRIFLEK